MSKIEWTEKTWNPIVGCSVVSPGCTNCYAMKFAARLLDGNPKMPHYGGTTKIVNGKAIWTGKVALASDHILTEPLRRRRPTTYFVNSMGDLFHEDVPDEWVDRVFAVMALCQQHTFQVLTKRAARMRHYMASEPQDRWNEQAAILMSWDDMPQRGSGPLCNVWLGVSAERQQEADERVPDLLATPAAVRFVSAEPLLGDINFEEAWHGCSAMSGECWGDCGWCGDGPTPKNPPMHNCRLHNSPDATKGRSGLDWIIVGGESGPDARPMHPDWARSIRAQCHEAGVPFFFKQWGEWAPGECCGPPPTRTERTATWWCDKWWFEEITKTAAREMHRDDEPDLYRIGKARAGRHIDGQEWNEMPATKIDEAAA